METNYNDVIKFISVSDKATLLNVSEALRNRFSHLQVQAAQSIEVGSLVSFVHFNGNKIVGTVIKTNRKTVKVRATDGVVWNVSAGLLKTHSQE